MSRKQKSGGGRRGLQALTLCISTALVLILLGLVVLTVLTEHNLSRAVKENLIVSMMLDQDLTDTEARKICQNLEKKRYVNQLEFVSKETALKECVEKLGADPSEFAGGNPFTASIELTLKAEYANNDSLVWISSELRNYPKVTEIGYQKDLIDAVNRNLEKISLGLLVLAVLLTFVSFSLINNTVRLGIYARRFSIHTMKLVGASWGFIRRPFLRQAICIGLLAAIIALVVIGGAIYALYRYEPDVQTVIGWREMAITAAAVVVFGVAITGLCAGVSVNKFLRMKAGELYKI